VSEARAHLVAALGRAPMVERHGRLVSAVGTTLRVAGLDARIGDQCEIADPTSDAPSLWAEVVGFADDVAILTPLGDLKGLAPGARPIVRSGRDRVPCGADLLGRVIDARGAPLDGHGPIPRGPERPLRAPPPPAMTRRPIERPVATGVRAVDALLTVGEGQRVGVFAGPGSGKTTLLGLLARGAQADAIVIALIGERGREVREFVEEVLGEEGRARSVTVVATSDSPAAQRVRAAHAATAIAEGMRAEGKHVLLLMDSVTRYARALRELGLAAGEPAVRRGYPPSVFAELPRLFERAGASETGAITGVYTVLLEDEEGDPIGDEVRSLLDGHVYLSRKLATRGHYPAVDVLASLSRLFPRLASRPQAEAAREVRSLLAKLDEIELLVQLGEYRPGHDALADRALAAREDLDAFLRQDMDEAADFASTVARLRALGAA